MKIFRCKNYVFSAHSSALFFLAMHEFFFGASACRIFFQTSFPCMNFFWELSTPLRLILRSTPNSARWSRGGGTEMKRTMGSDWLSTCADEMGLLPK